MKLSVARAFHRTHLVRGKGKKKLAPTSHQSKKKKTEERRGGVAGCIYKQGRGIRPGSWYEPGQIPRPAEVSAENIIKPSFDDLSVNELPNGLGSSNFTF